MTERLFYQQPYLREFEARIVKSGASDLGPWVMLDKTAFYPTSGGQPNDTGLINGVRVVDVVESGEDILHITESPLSVGEKLVSCKIDWERRFDFMQQHAGQHLLSGAFERTLDAETIGFHLTGQSLTIDLATASVGENDLNEAEDLANEVIYNNLGIRSLWPDESELKAMPLRKPPARLEGIRIIEVDGFDWSPCGGTHPASTGEIGMVKIIGTEKVRAGTRVSFVCGKRALLDYRHKDRGIRAVAARFSVAVQDLEKAADALFEQNTALHKRLEALNKQAIESEARAFWSTGEQIFERVFENRSPADLRALALLITSEPSRIAVLGALKPSIQVLVARSDNLTLDARLLIEPAKKVLDGRGGGNPRVAQSGGTEPDLVPEAVQAVASLAKKRMA